MFEKHQKHQDAWNRFLSVRQLAIVIIAAGGLIGWTSAAAAEEGSGPGARIALSFMPISATTSNRLASSTDLRPDSGRPGSTLPGGNPITIVSPPAISPGLRNLM